MAKFFFEPWRYIDPVLNSSFYRVKQISGKLHPGQDTSLELEIPPVDQGTHLYTWVERGNRSKFSFSRKNILPNKWIDTLNKSALKPTEPWRLPGWHWDYFSVVYWQAFGIMFAVLIFNFKGRTQHYGFSISLPQTILRTAHTLGLPTSSD